MSASGAASSSSSSSSSAAASSSTATASQFTYSSFPVPASASSSSSSAAFPVPFHLQQQPYTYSSYQPSPYEAAPRPSAVVQVPQYTYPTVYAGPISLPQHQQAQQLFQRDAQIITPEALENVKAALASGDNEQKAETKRKAVPRKAAGMVWEDSTLADWPENDYRLFCGDLGNEVNDEVLTKAFSRYSSFNMARVVRDKRTGKTKGYGFVSFSNPSDLTLALKEMNGKYVGNRPIKLRKSTWKERTDSEAFERHKGGKKQKTSKKSVAHK